VGVVTDLKVQKRKGRVNLFIDGKFALGLPLEIVCKERLSVGQRISPQKLENLAKENELDKILNRVYRFLSYRPRSKKEIERYLAKIGAGEVVANLVINKLEKQKYIDDFEFARWWVEQRIEFRPVGEEKLRAELFQKGVRKEIIEEVIKSQIPKPKSQNLAFKVAKKILPRYKGLSQAEFRRKMGSFLARRGFDWETIKETVDRIQKDL